MTGRTAWRHPLATAVLAALVATGCRGPQLATTPNLYVDSDENPFADVPPRLQTSTVEIAYLTDRVRTDDHDEMDDTDGMARYGYGRSRSLAFGLCTVQIGPDDLPWHELVEASRSRRRRTKMPIRVISTRELIVGPETPVPYVEIDGTWVQDPDIVQHMEAAGRAIAQRIDEAMARSERKEVFLFIHGYNNTFEDAALRMAQLWHFMGRVGVPVIYSWPAGHPGLLRGYNYDRESGEYTIRHLRVALRFLAASPHVEKIHLIAHSRGTDVLLSAIRELNLYYEGAGLDTREELKIASLVLAAPDLDFEVVTQRVVAERIHRRADMMTMYLSEDDRAIGLSSWLFSSLARLGQLTSDDLTKAQQQSLDRYPNLQLVSVRTKTDWLGHGYFISNPAVLSDLILVLRDGRLPGAEHGRPLRHSKGFWELDSDYPATEEPTD